MRNVSAIIVNYNAGPLLKESFNMLLGSASVAKVFVVDNGSTDHSMDEMDQLAALQSRLICIRNSKNLGFARACNIGVEAAGNCEYLLFLNPDCLIDGNALELLLAFMKSSPETGMAGPLLLNPDGTEQSGGRRSVPTPWRSFIRAFGLSKLGQRFPRLFTDFLLHQQPLPDSPAEVEAISGSCMLVRREALSDVGLLDENYFMHCEDLDWCMRFRQKGWKIMFVPDARVVHHQGTCSQARPVFVEWHKHKGMMRFYRKFFRHQYPGLLLWIVGIGVWLRFGAVAVFHSARNLMKR
ncbi:MAG: glycosyltransferase family 2 protein [Smithella sp.]